MAEMSWIDKAKVAATVLARHAEDVDRTARWPEESVAALGEAGLMGLTLPAELGGGDQGPRTFTQITRILAQECASTAMIYLMHVCAAQVIAAAVDLPRRAQILREIATGLHLCTLAFSEKGSRSHFWRPVSQEAVDGDGRRLSAQKSWVTSAGRADSYIVSTRAAGRPEPTASTLYLVPRDAAGLHTAGVRNGLGLRGNASAPMSLDGVPVSAADRVSPEGGGLDIMLSTVLPWFQAGSAAVALGIAQAALAGTRQHLLVSKMVHLGQSLASLMNLRARLARMHILVNGHSAFLEHVTRLMERPGPDTLVAVLASKAAAGETALEVTDLAMRACGGAAFSRHLAVERNFRDARACAVMAPTTDVLYDFIGKALLNLPLFD
jgi:alkylation response protein AidB-like acyl-CoA dehydrogenase